MAKFKSQNDYENWKIEKAIKRGAAKDLEKLDRERPYYEGDKKWSGAGRWLTIALAVALAVLAAALYWTRPGQIILDKALTFLKQFL